VTEPAPFAGDDELDRLRAVVAYLEARVVELSAEGGERQGLPSTAAKPDRALLRAVRSLADAAGTIARAQQEAVAASAAAAAAVPAPPHEVVVERDRLAALLRAIDAELRDLLASRRWQVGNRVVGATTIGRARHRDELASTRLLRLLDSVAAPLAPRPPPIAEPPAPAEQLDAAAVTVWATPAPRQYDVVVLANVDWDTRFQRPQHLATTFGRHGHRVFYVVASHWLPDDHPTGYELRELAPGVWEVRLAAPHDPDRYRRIATEPVVDRWVEAFERFADDVAMENAAIHVHLQSWTPLAFELRRRLGWRVVYDCMDEWHDFPGMGQSLVTTERELVEGADLVSVTAEALLQKWLPVNPSCVLVRNGVDATWFERHAGPSDLLLDVGRPVVGFLGAIAEWVDLELVAEVARRRPEWTVRLVGDVFVDDLAGLDELPNVQLAGLRPHAEMPLWLFTFDVALIPFRVDHISAAVDPVKFYEYVSLGTPVVATELPELAAHREHLYVAGDAEGFVAAIETALAEPEHRQLARASVARANSWDERHRVLDAATRQLWPMVSVVVVTFGRLDLTKACVDSLLANTGAYLEHLEATQPCVRVVRNQENRGFAAANNQGLAIAGGDVLVLLNNDTSVAGGWVEPLMAHLEDPSIGLVGPRSDNVGNEARYDVTIENNEDYARVTHRLRADHARECFDIRMLAMFCVAMRREVYEKVGGLDEGYGVGLFEDDDYAERIKEAGLRVVCAADAFVHHVGQGTFGGLIRSGEYEELWATNKARFEARWGPWKAQP
jgi:glycosyltransferase involved in cell wall biosynthesis